MGANASKNSNKSLKNATQSTKPKVEESVDLGAVFPNGLYPSTEQDYDTRILKNLIMSRKIAPFYKGLADAPGNVSDTLSPCPESSLSHDSLNSQSSKKKLEGYDPYLERKRAHQEKMNQRKKMLYNDAVECPICFLYYPANINYSRCCDQPICTECFVQIHRPIETPSTPATCPFCMQENYGILYEPPAWSEKFQARSRSGSHSTMSGTRHTTSGLGESDGPRRESVSHKNPDVVLVDHIRPDWNKTPTNNPVTPLSRRNSASAGRHLRAVGSLLTRPGRSASSAAVTPYHPVRDMNNIDIEDWMVMEAIRLSLAEQEEYERKEAIKRSLPLIVTSPPDQSSRPSSSRGPTFDSSHEGPKD